MGTLPVPNGPRQGQLFHLHFEFNGQEVRCGGSKDRPWFVLADVCAVLGIIDSNSAQRGIPATEKGVQTLRTRGGKQRLAVVYEPGLYRLVFRSNKPDAEKFQTWVFTEVLPAIRRTGEYSMKRRERYERLGKDPEWIESREQGIEVRKGFTAELKAHSVAGPGYGIVTDAIYTPILGAGTQTVKGRLGLTKADSLRDNLPRLHLLMVGLSEEATKEKIKADDIRGNQPCKLAAARSANAIAGAVRQIRSS
jgi:prophage antirepressor-like protein